MVTAILLSAGFSSRFGSPKALAQVKGKAVIVQLQQALIDSQVYEIIVVLGDNAEKIKPYILNHKKVSFVYNKDYNLGQTSSFKAGLNEADPASQAMLLIPVDTPFIQSSTVDQMIEVFLTQKSRIVIPVYKNRKGHPPIFSASLKTDFLNLDNDEGINSISHKYEAETVLYETDDPGVVLSFNTQEEFDKILADNDFIV